MFPAQTERGMDESGGDELVELDADSWISVEIDRQWPKYVATWSIRRRAGDSDYPVLTGKVERLPPRDPAELDNMLAGLRREAMDQATAAAAGGEQDRRNKRSGFLNRLLGRD